ncbi:MAG TPA: outer membrane beta-barrel protein [Blastocatellia bacterium]|nr:outer membrane beta-barrel protein [Blastocatellia bacterium]
MRRILLLLIVALCSPLALAQQSASPDYPRFEWFLGYSAVGDANEENGRLLMSFGSNTGLETSLTRNLSKHWGIKGDFSAHWGTSRGTAMVVVQPPGTTENGTLEFDHRHFNFLVGPEFKWRNHTRLTPFAHTLVGVGVSKGDGRLTFPGGTSLIKISNTGVALALGGGFDIRVSKRFSFRTSVDYNPAYIGGGTTTDPRNWRDQVRFSVGIVFH